MIAEVRKPTAKELEEMEVFSWPIWECEPSTFEWIYSDRETCYLLEGRVTVEGEGETVSFGAGDLVVFPRGLSCVWKVEQAVRKHYKMG